MIRFWWPWPYFQGHYIIQVPCNSLDQNGADVHADLSIHWAHMQFRRKCFARFLFEQCHVKVRPPGICQQWRSRAACASAEDMKLFSCSAEREIWPANKSRITNNCKLFLVKHSSSSVTQMWPITLYFIHHRWDNSLTFLRPHELLMRQTDWWSQYFHE